MPETVNSLEGSTELRRILKSIRNSALWSTFFKKFSEEIETNGRYHWMPLRMCGSARHSSFYTRAEYTDGTKQRDRHILTFDTVRFAVPRCALDHVTNLEIQETPVQLLTVRKRWKGGKERKTESTKAAKKEEGCNEGAAAGEHRHCSEQCILL